MINATTIAALRTTPPTNDDELRESLKRESWWPDHPAVQDEHGIILVGNRRIRIAGELRIDPVIVTITFGEGEEADNRRVQRALSSNTSSGVTTEDRKALAISLFKRENWTQERIARIVRVDRSMESWYLDGICDPVTNSPPRAEKRGRPKGSGKTPKLSAEARVSPIGRIAEPTTEGIKTDPTIDPATLFQSAHAAILREGDRVVRAAEWDAERTHLKARIVELEAEVEKLRRATPVKLTHSGKFVMDREVFRHIKARLHPDLTNDSVEGRRLHDAFTAFMNLPITTIGEEERREAQRLAEVREEQRRQGYAARLRREAAARKGQETKRRKAEAAARETIARDSGSTGA